MPDRHPLKYIRNFSIIAHIDHGKSTLADRLLEKTNTISKREMQEQVLDDMDLERERGITIKARPVTMYYTFNGDRYQMNFIDTPGHVDFSYEVSRSLSACEGALLVVDAVQGVQAQTLANVSLAMEKGLEIIPVINKVDLPAADPEKIKREIQEMLLIDSSRAIGTSAKTGEGVDQILEEILYLFPSPKYVEGPLKALVFDSHYDPYRGIMVYVRIVSGSISKKDPIYLMATKKTFEVKEVGIFSPNEKEVATLFSGEVGYILAHIKKPSDVKIGDTITLAYDRASEALEGFKQIHPVVFASIYPIDASDLETLFDALHKLQLNDSALTVDLETSLVLGSGYRCGFLGLLHLEIIFERIQREFSVDILTTAPSVEYRIYLKNGKQIPLETPSHFPDPSSIAFIEEPWVTCCIFTQADYLGQILTLLHERRGDLTRTETIDKTRLYLHAKVPLNEIITDFNDRLKSVSQGYASFNYEQDHYEKSDVIKLDMLVNGESIDAFSSLVHRSKALQKGRFLCKKLLEEIPRQQFEIRIQAAIGGKIIARETISALCKKVTAKCYGGDITRKMKLLRNQKKNKKKMKQFGKVMIPQEAFIKVLQGEGENRLKGKKNR